MHPVESNTVGLYNEPVCILDFASLYPSLFRAYNLSYDTLLVNKDDAKHLSKEDIFTSPTGAYLYMLLQAMGSQARLTIHCLTVSCCKSSTHTLPGAMLSPAMQKEVFMTLIGSLLECYATASL